MYGVSAAYKTAMQQPVHRFKIAGTVGGAAFTEADVLAGSLSITNQFSSGQDFKIGSVVIGSLSCTFIRGSGIVVAENDVITLSEGLQLSDTTYEYVPMGVFVVAEANRTAAGTVVKAYDLMTLFDKDFPYDTTYGTAYDILHMACQECDATIGMTQADMQALPNGTRIFTLYSENDIETWRDLIYWLAQAMACFATMDRSGRLVFRSFAGSAVDEIDSTRRFKGASFSNFLTKYSGISIENLTDGTTSYYGLPDDQYLTYNLGKNPFLQYGEIEVRDAMRMETLTGLSAVEFTPFKAKTRVGGAYDLGDILTHSEGLGADSQVCVMRFVWKYGKSYEAEGVGKNPRLASAKSKTDKDISGLINRSTQEDKIQHYLFINSSNIVVSDGETKEIIDIRFTTNKKTVVLFHAEILADADTGQNDTLLAEFSYRFNEIDMAYYKPRQTMIDGKHIVHLFYPFEINDVSMNHLEVFLTASGGAISINAGEIRADVYGQGMAATSAWDGLIDVRQEISLSNLGVSSGVTGVSVIESISANTQEPVGDSIEQEIGVATMGVSVGILMVGFTEDLDLETEEA